MEFMVVLIGFLLNLIASGFIIYLVTKLFGEKEGFGTALLAAFIGSIIFSLGFYLIGIGFVAALISGIAWLIALGMLYKIGWLRSLVIAVFIWLFAIIVSIILPNITFLS